MNAPRFWVRTSSGRDIDLENPKPTDITIEDIAHALARINRFSGNTTHAYSVAEHSVRVCNAVEERSPGNHKLALRALLHDAAEAYVGDTTSPVKALIRKHTYVLDVTEGKIWRAICDRFELGHFRSDPPIEEPAIIKEMDMVLCATEWRDLIPPGPTEVTWPFVASWPFPARAKRLPTPVHAERAEFVFMERFEELTRAIAKDKQEGLRILAAQEST